LIRFIQNAAGWAVTGDNSEQYMFILFGTGANGKSTFLNTVMNLLGDYAIATPTETFMRKSGEHITNDIARLRGTRFVTTTEVEEENQDKHLEQKLMKEGSGILNWLLEGARRWYTEGLRTSNVVVNATSEYRSEMDVIGNFI
jgi:putative DNA primase/helicase